MGVATASAQPRLRSYYGTRGASARERRVTSSTCNDAESCNRTIAQFGFVKCDCFGPCSSVLYQPLSSHVVIHKGTLCTLTVGDEGDSNDSMARAALAEGRLQHFAMRLTSTRRIHWAKLHGQGQRGIIDCGARVGAALCVLYIRTSKRTPKPGTNNVAIVQTRWRVDGVFGGNT